MIGYGIDSSFSNDLRIAFVEKTKKIRDSFEIVIGCGIDSSFSNDLRIIFVEKTKKNGIPTRLNGNGINSRFPIVNWCLSPASPRFD